MVSCYHSEGMDKLIWSNLGYDKNCSKTRKQLNFDKQHFVLHSTEAKLEFKGKLPFVYLYCVVRDIRFIYRYYLKLHKNMAALNFACWLVFF